MSLLCFKQLGKIWSLWRFFWLHGRPIIWWDSCTSPCIFLLFTTSSIKTCHWRSGLLFLQRLVLEVGWHSTEKTKDSLNPSKGQRGTKGGRWRELGFSLLNPPSPSLDQHATDGHTYINLGSPNVGLIMRAENSSDPERGPNLQYSSCEVIEVL